MSFQAHLLMALAVVMTTAASTIIGTIIFANILGNYERPAKYCFWAGFAGSILILICQGSIAASLTAAVWLSGISAALIAGWLLLVFSRR